MIIFFIGSYVYSLYMYEKSSIEMSSIFRVEAAFERFQRHSHSCLGERFDPVKNFGIFICDRRVLREDPN